MIWYIIVGIIVLVAIALVLSCVWEVDKTNCYTYDKNGNIKRDAENIDEYQSNPSVILEALKEIYPEDYAREEKWATEHKRNDSYILSELRYHRLPCKGYIKKKLQVSSYWYEEPRGICGWVALGICLIALGVMIGTNVSTKMKWSVQEQTVKYEERITKLENNKQYILTYYTYGVSKDIDISSTNIPAVIKEHNNEVEELAQKIRVDTINLSNPWISPWVNPACKNIDLKKIVGDPNDPNDTGLYISKLA